MVKYYPPNRYSTLAILLSIASLTLVLSAVFRIQLLSITYGVGAGAQIQANATSKNVTPILQQAASNVSSIYNTILIEYVSMAVALGMLISSALLYRYRVNILTTEAREHITLHGTLFLIYALLFFINNAGILVQMSMYYIAVVYVAMLMCASIDIYVIFSRYVLPARMAPRKTDLQLDPSKPYTNLIRIKDKIFSGFSGKIGVVDKHMNSVGLENFHRLIRDNLDSLSEINIITSKEMLDSEFSRNYLDSKSEAENSGVKFNVMIMNENDSMVQHERFVFDDKNAYKVPPFNIIHKKSEHITRIKLSEARSRFDQLYRKSIKYENFVTRASQDGQKH